MKQWIALVAAFAIGNACSSEMEAPQVPVPDFPVPTGTWSQVIPGPEMPAELTTYVSNNNLDVALFNDRVYVAFRTAPSHFAGPDTLIHLVSTADLESLTNWRLEKTWFTGKDLREPRMVAHGDKLFVYISELGTDLTNFDPGRVFASTLHADGNWEGPTDVFTDGRVLWRLKSRNGRIYSTSYIGGEEIYQNRQEEGGGLEVYFYESTDGLHWAGIDGSNGIVYRGGGSETGFEFDPDGNLFAIIRNEAGDQTGFGSIACQAAADNLATWECDDTSDPYKYDSPFMFRWQSYLYLIARYSPIGPYDHATDAPSSQSRFWRNEIRYSTTAKQTALYGYNTSTRHMELLDRFPSSGDTAFAAGVWIDGDRFLVFNYSSDIDHPDIAWIEGQFRGSQIYASILDFQQQKEPETVRQQYEIP